MNKQEITNLINSTIIDNDNGLITAETMRDVLNAINEGTGDGYTYIGVATPSTTPIPLTGNEKVFYIATEEGDYSNFGVGNITELSIIKSENGNWSVENFRLNFLSLKGGTMLGDINMNGKMIHNIGIAEVNSLPTTNLYEGRMVRFKNKTYTFYNGLWLALSDDLRGHTNDTHEENFVYQPTASDLSVKDGFADIKKLKGNTVVWNQKFINKSFISTGVNITTSEDALILNGTLTTTYLGITNAALGIAKIPLNHIGYYRIVIVKDNSNILRNKLFGLLNRGKNITITQNTAKFLYQNTNDSQGWGFGISEFSGGEVFEDVQIKANVFDLTQMFGEGNEPATVEEFEAMFPNAYYEYNEGELMSFDGKGVKSVGFNLFDKTKVESESYLYSITGISIYRKGLKENVSDFIRVIPGVKYYVNNIISGEHRATWVYDNNKMPLKVISMPNKGTIDGKFLASREITIPDNAHYIRFCIYDEYLDSACINLSHSGYRNGEYEPYEDYTLSFQDGNTISQLTGKLNGEGDSVVIFPDGLRSAGTAYDEIIYDEAMGKHKAIKRIGERSYITGDESQLNTLTDKINTYYELAEPEVYELDFPINTSYEAYDFGTEEVLYNDENAVNIPMKADIEYGFNAVDMIRNNFAEIKALKERVTALEQAILQIQAANTANEQIE